MEWINQLINELEKEKAEAEEQIALLGNELFTRSKTMESDWVDTTEANKLHYQALVERLQLQIDRLNERMSGK